MSKILDLDVIGIDSSYSTNMKPAENIILRMDKETASIFTLLPLFGCFR